MYSVLLIGQSNMAGRGIISEVEPIVCDKLFMLRNGKWQPMKPPINFDRPFAGINLAESFALRFFVEYGEEVGLIPCADGGSSLSQWAPGELLFDHAVMMTRLALRTSELAAILWHQGEADCSDALYPQYTQRLLPILEGIKAAVGRPDIPVLVGGLGDFLKDCSHNASLKNYTYINTALSEMAGTHKGYGFVSAKGLTSNPDMLHFNAQSLRIFGERYFEEYKKLAGKNILPCAPNAENSKSIGAMEML